jgi:hypothetical protein
MGIAMRRFFWNGICATRKDFRILPRSGFPDNEKGVGGTPVIGALVWIMER